MVGCTIDAGAKIYAGRVDSVHSDILKMLGSMGQAGGDEDGPDSGEFYFMHLETIPTLCICTAHDAQCDFKVFRNQSS